MKYTVTKSVIYVIGRIWLPPVMCAMNYELTDYDISNLLHSGPEGTMQTVRELTEQWIARNSGDFQSIEDFCASLEIDGETVEIPWANPDSLFVYNDCVFWGRDYE